jgi:acetate CoA/acetoacetate CoA-transferase alpha subunit
MHKRITIEEALDKVQDGMTIMVGGFLGCGNPHRLIEELSKRGVKDLTLICNDTSFPDYGVGKMVVNKQFKKIIASHVGTNPETGRQMNEKETEVVLVPQGTLAEQVRAGGAGLGGILTPTGVGTVVEEGKQKLTVDGVEYLLEKPLRADVALIAAQTADEFGNLVYFGATRNFNNIMATAADIVIAEVEEIVAVGEIDPNHVVTPGIFVSHIVNGGEK